MLVTVFKYNYKTQNDRCFKVFTRIMLKYKYVLDCIVFVLMMHNSYQCHENFHAIQLLLCSAYCLVTVFRINIPVYKIKSGETK